LDQGDHTIPIPGTRSATNLKDFSSGATILFTDSDRADIKKILPVGWAHGDRYSDAQVTGVERYC
jgi:aryl-alcohol dehydrogenase-like predicted oxidoreductase